MANNSFHVDNSLNIEPKSSPNLTERGDIGFDTSSPDGDKLQVYASLPSQGKQSIVTEESFVSSLSNKNALVSQAGSTLQLASDTGIDILSGTEAIALSANFSGVLGNQYELTMPGNAPSLNIQMGSSGTLALNDELQFGADVSGTSIVTAVSDLNVVSAAANARLGAGLAVVLDPGTLVQAKKAVEIKNQSTPLTGPTLDSGYGSVYPGDDGNVYFKNSSGAVAQLQTGSTTNIVDSQISANASISRNKIKPGTANFVLINDATGLVSEEAQLAVSRGGTGKNFSSSTGLVKMAAGVASTATLVDADVSATASITRTKIKDGTASHVVINDATGNLSSEAQLSTLRGGTGVNSSASSGIAHVAAGSWTFSSIVDADVSATASITRTKIKDGTANHVVINDATGNLSSEAQLATSRGGTGVNSSASSGVAHVSGGSWTFSSIVDADISATASITRTKIKDGTANHVVINDSTGNLSSEAQLAASRGGTGVNSSASSGIAHLSSGSWTFSSIVDADVSATASITRTKIKDGTANHVVINDSTGNLSSEANLAISRGGTSAGTKAGAFDALSPMTTSGDIIYGGTSGTGTRLAKGADGTVLTLASGLPSWAATSAGTVAYGQWKHTTNSATTAWTRTNTSLGDPAAITVAATGVAFAAVGTNSGFTTVVSQKSGADFLPGIVVTPATSGYYFVSARFIAFTATGAAVSDWSLTDGSISYDQTECRDGAGGGANAYTPIVLSGIINITTSGATIKIQMSSDSGAANIQNNRGATTITWTLHWVGA